MFIVLSEIESDPVEVEATLELADLKAPSGGRLLPEGLRLSGQAIRGTLGVELRARWEGTVRQQCGRCLEPFDLRLSDAFFLILTPGAAEYGAAEQEMHPEDADLYHGGGDRVDLGGVAAEQVQLALPLKPVCREDCGGLCPTCGANRNRLECGCRRDEVDPRLAPLLDLKNRLGDG